jgi:hypothetical protein
MITKKPKKPVSPKDLKFFKGPKALDRAFEFNAKLAHNAVVNPTQHNVDRSELSDYCILMQSLAA